VIRIRRLAASMCAIVVAQVCLAQTRPSDSPSVSPPTASTQAKTVESGNFIAAYKRAGSPRLLVYCDLAGTSAAGAAPSEVGNTLRAGIEAILRDPEVILLSPPFAQDLGEKQTEALRRGGSYEAARVVGKAANADVVLYLRLIEQAGKSPWYTGTSVLVDLRRGSTLGRFSWDMVPGASGFDAAQLSGFAKTIAGRTAEHLAQAFPAGGNMTSARRFTVRVVGDYQPEDLTLFRRALDQSTGVKQDSVQVRSEDKTDAGNVATLELMYSGELPDLRRLVRRGVVDQMGMEADLIDAREGSIGLKLLPLTLSAREKLLTGGARNNRNSSERDRLKLAYANASKPSIGVIFNRSLGESGEPVQGAAVDNSEITVGDRVKLGAAGLTTGFTERFLERHLRDPGKEPVDTPMDLRVFEDRVCERLLQLGTNLRDLSEAQSALARMPDFKGRQWTDSELALALGRSAQANVLVSAIAQITRAGEGPQRLAVTLRAFDVASGGVIATATVEQTVDKGAEALVQAAEEVSAEAVGKLAAQLTDRWEGAARK